MNFYYSIIASILLSLIFSACSSNGKIEPETLAKIYVDNLIIEEQFRNQDSVRIKKENILRKYSVTKKDYENAIKSLDYDKEKWETFFALSKSYLDTLQTRFDKSEAKNKLKK